jgi:opacity protein-like surface antigen
MKLKLLAAAILAATAQAASAAYLYVGSYAVLDGPEWPSNPAVYSARQAAAVVFGGSFWQYAISTNADTTDASTITFTGWYDGWGEHDGMEFHQDYRLDLGAPGYNDPGGEGTARSAYVRDGLFDTDTFRNHVWLDTTAQPPVPEPSTYAFAVLGVAGVVVSRRFAMRKARQG